jgi:hypothetical protein
MLAALRAAILRPWKWVSSQLSREEFMITRTPPQSNDVDRLPKNFPALQERMDAVKRSNAEKQQAPSRSPLESTPVVEKDDSFFLL